MQTLPGKIPKTDVSPRPLHRDLLGTVSSTEQCPSQRQARDTSSVFLQRSLGKVKGKRLVRTLQGDPPEEDMSQG